MVSILFRDVAPEEQPNVMPNYWWPIYNDAYDHLQLQVLTAAQGSMGTNAGYYSNARVDELMTIAAETTDQQAYQDAIFEVQEIVTYDDPAAIYYLQREWTTVLRKTVANFVANPINIGTYDYWKLRRTA
jgi:peptide/nickel transport system substrate-binding protein